jgi:hypothetical protein
LVLLHQKIQFSSKTNQNIYGLWLHGLATRPVIAETARINAAGALWKTKRSWRSHVFAQRKRLGETTGRLSSTNGLPQPAESTRHLRTIPVVKMGVLTLEKHLRI